MCRTRCQLCGRRSIPFAEPVLLMVRMERSTACRISGTVLKRMPRSREKLGVSSGEAVRVVLESDGTQVEDGDYFRTLPPNTVLLLLRQGETWGPVGGVDVIRAAISAIPKIVCETIHALELHRDETPSPSWKIMDNKGRVTVVLHWDHPQHHYQPPPPSSRSHPRNSSTTASSSSPSLGLGPDGAVDVGSASMTRPSLVIHGAGTTTVGRDGKKETLINDVYTPARYGGGGGGTSPQITVINHDAATARAIGSSYGGAAGSGGTTGGSSVGGVHHPPRLSRQGSGGSSFESGAAIHVHTAECSTHHLHHPMHSSSPPAPSPSGHDPQGPHQHGGGVTECDFHCCALHEEGRRIAVHKSVATSPIQDHAQSQDGGARASRSTGLAPPSAAGKQHVRFLDIESGVEGAVPRGGSPMGGPARPPAVTTAIGTSPGGATSSAGESSESETETTLLEEEGATSEKFLLLVDQPASMDARRHLTIKDIGVILERLRSKIVDVERLERDSDGGTGGSGGGGAGDGAGSGRGGAGAGGAGSGSDDCHNWTIKATIRGETLRELGVIYNGNYYAISEHPGYRAEGSREEEEGDGEEVEDDDEEEEEDRL
ncbi:hypothetical protein J437_LFUL019110 [Ladona fulva]|uniref:CIDE-N domain-containing protein n=1 Tax=Ladona fulva TaxID=123851 RepID=A0A8K0PDU0_LADFU|nr:hypothetical protein J437_LFUL019110 [Ladona fulva]